MALRERHPDEVICPECRTPMPTAHMPSCSWRTATHAVVHQHPDVPKVYTGFPTDEYAVHWASLHLPTGEWFYAQVEPTKQVT